MPFSAASCVPDPDEHCEAGIALDQGGDVRVVRSGKKVSFPMPWHSLILNLSHLNGVGAVGVGDQAMGDLTT